MNRSKAIILLVLAAVILVLPPPSPAQQKDYSLNVGIGVGDFNKSFVAGLTGSKPLASFVQGEAELFYYRMPADRSTIFGMAITSTALDLNLNILLQAFPEGGKFIPYAVIIVGVLYESETWKYSLSKTKESHSYAALDVGLGTGAKINLGVRSGLRLDFRWLCLLGKDKQVPRFSLGYFYRY